MSYIHFVLLAGCLLGGVFTFLVMVVIRSMFDDQNSENNISNRFQMYFDNGFESHCCGLELEDNPCDDILDRDAWSRGWLESYRLSGQLAGSRQG